MKRGFLFNSLQIFELWTVLLPSSSTICQFVVVWHLNDGAQDRIALCVCQGFIQKHVVISVHVWRESKFLFFFPKNNISGLFWADHRVQHWKMSKQFSSWTSRGKNKHFPLSFPLFLSQIVLKSYFLNSFPPLCCVCFYLFSVVHRHMDTIQSCMWSTCLQC